MFKGIGKRLTFERINGGKAYVEDLSAKAKYGRNDPQSPDGKAHFFGSVIFDDIEDEETLLAKTREKLEELSKERYTYTAKVTDLSKYGFEHEGVGFGDRAVIDKEKHDYPHVCLNMWKILE